MTIDELREYHKRKAEGHEMRARVCRAAKDNLEYYAQQAARADTLAAFHKEAAFTAKEQKVKLHIEWSNGYSQGYMDAREDLA